jgi:predicted Zn-dependent peptidase
MPSPALSQCPEVTTLANGVRIVTLPLPAARTAAVGVFVGSGSAHEGRADSGIGHVVEHMVFKGSATRDARRINLDAERLGAEVNAHTDKDHTAFHMRGLGRDVPALLAMLGDLVLAPAFPTDEFEREREVLLHEFTETEDDPMATAFALFDRACWGMHPAAMPVIGQRRHIERFTRADLAGWVARQYTGANLVVAAAGDVDADAALRAAERVFGAAPAGTPHRIERPVYEGAIKSRVLEGSSQAHVVLGFPIPGLDADDPAAEMAAAVFGEGMSSPLMQQVREERALAYYTACSADRYAMCGQFVVEASVAPKELVTLVETVMALLARHATAIDPLDLGRARQQLAVRKLAGHEKPLARLEDAALDLFVHGQVRSAQERLDRLLAVDAEHVRAVFATMLRAGASLAVTGSVPRRSAEALRAIVDRHRAAAS